jgi:hypothetical protein
VKHICPDWDVIAYSVVDVSVQSAASVVALTHAIESECSVPAIPKSAVRNNQFRLFHILTTYLSKMHFNILLSSFWFFFNVAAFQEVSILKFCISELHV